jgi:hypothetical protein
MREVNNKVYQFDELSAEAQKKVLNDMSDINVDFPEWSEGVIEFFTESKGAHFNITNVYFSGFCSQGDGAMFEYSGITQKLLNEAVDSLRIDQKFKSAILLIPELFQFEGTHSGHYYHENSCSHGVGFDETGLRRVDSFIERYMFDIQDYVKDIYKTYCKELYHNLQKQYEQLTSEGMVIESIRANEYEFYADGTLFVDR